MLRVTQLTNYGIALLGQLAAQSSHHHLSSRDLATALGLPLSITAKILKSLTREGLLVSHRGINGGYALARPAVSISIAEIVIALEGPLPLTAPLNSSSELHPCDFINRTIQQTLQQISLSEMVQDVQMSVSQGPSEDSSHSESPSPPTASSEEPPQ